MTGHCGNSSAEFPIATPSPSPPSPEHNNSSQSSHDGQGSSSSSSSSSLPLSVAQPRPAGVGSHRVHPQSAYRLMLSAPSDRAATPRIPSPPQRTDSGASVSSESPIDGETTRKLARGEEDQTSALCQRPTHSTTPCNPQTNSKNEMKSVQSW